MARLLRLDQSQEVFHLQRLRLLEGTELLLDDSYLPLETAQAAELQNFQDNESLFRRLETTGTTLVYGEKEVKSILADTYLAEVLGYREGGPLFHVRTLTFNHRGQPTLLSELNIRADRYTIKIVAKRK